MSIEYFKTLVDYNYGENRKVWDGCIMQLTDEQFYQDTGYSHGSIHEELVHVMSGDWWWLSRAKGQSPQAGLKAVDYPTRELIRAKWDVIEADVRAFVNGLDDASLASPVQYTNPRGEVIDNHVWKILLHMCNHSLIHRAEIFAIAHQVGGPTFDLSMMRYLYDGRY